jgi:hypothetical protein
VPHGRLQGRIALITGGGCGIDAAITLSPNGGDVML